jgi:hypothetical protein
MQSHVHKLAIIQLGMFIYIRNLIEHKRRSQLTTQTGDSMATFAYGQVSTKDQTTENLRFDKERAGFKVVYWFADAGVSGKTHASQRPQFKALLGQIRDGETLVVAKLDRLGRDAQDVGATIKAVADRKIEVIVVQLGKLDLASPADKMMLNMLAAVDLLWFVAGNTGFFGAYS